MDSLILNSRRWSPSNNKLWAWVKKLIDEQLCWARMFSDWDPSGFWIDCDSGVWLCSTLLRLDSPDQFHPSCEDFSDTVLPFWEIMTREHLEIEIWALVWTQQKAVLDLNPNCLHCLSQLLKCALFWCTKSRSEHARSHSRLWSGEW